MDLAIEEAGHVDAQRAHAREKHYEINKELQPSIRSHFRISPGKAGPRSGSRTEKQ
jgi:hypothetical protein